LDLEVERVQNASPAEIAVAGVGTGLMVAATFPQALTVLITKGRTLFRGATANASRRAAAAEINASERALLRDFFGQGMRGARARADDFRIPDGLGRETLQKYRRVAEDAIRQGIDKSGVQAERIKLIDRALDTLQ